MIHPSRLIHPLKIEHCNQRRNSDPVCGCCYEPPGADAPTEAKDGVEGVFDVGVEATVGGHKAGGVEYVGVGVGVGIV